MRIQKIYFTVLVAVFLMVTGIKMNAQNSNNSTLTLAERLGYTTQAKLLIIHNDDIGLAHSVNRAAFDAYKNGVVNSGSIMVPCPWFGEAAELAGANPGFDLGIHLTLTAEWRDFRWGGVSASSVIPSLLDPQKYFYRSVENVVTHATAEEVEKECRAQIDRAISFGIQPTHFDTHMGTLFGSPNFVDVYLKLGKEYNIPVFLPRASIEQSNPDLIPVLEQGGFIMADRFFMAEPDVQSDQWMEYYVDIIENLQPGITQIIIHVAYDNDEAKAVMVDHPNYGSAWRRRDFDVFTSERIKNVIKKNNVQLVTWREIGKLLK